MNVKQSGDGTCFPSKSQVELRSGKKIPISELAIGDTVKTFTKNGAVVFSPVITFLEQAPDYKGKIYHKQIPVPSYLEIIANNNTKNSITSSCFFNPLTRHTRNHHRARFPNKFNLPKYFVSPRHLFPWFSPPGEKGGSGEGVGGGGGGSVVDPGEGTGGTGPPPYFFAFFLKCRNYLRRIQHP